MPKDKMTELKEWYKDGKMTNENVAKCVRDGYITPAQYKEITGEKYEGSVKE